MALKCNKYDGVCGNWCTTGINIESTFIFTVEKYAIEKLLNSPTESAVAKYIC